MLVFLGNSVLDNTRCFVPLSSSGLQEALQEFQNQDNGTQGIKVRVNDSCHYAELDPARVSPFSSQSHPHLPQLNRSLPMSVHFQLQQTEGYLHLFLHLPQLFTSVITSTHFLAQQLGPAGLRLLVRQTPELPLQTTVKASPELP
ncbi:hypothetical protein SUGI_0185770 [Cryptomeria japonica]|nr:hypothetical protein SUGI_0185770 [Cryptomeria japonica]